MWGLIWDPGLHLRTKLIVTVEYFFTTFLSTFDCSWELIPPFGQAFPTPFNLRFGLLPCVVPAPAGGGGVVFFSLVGWWVWVVVGGGAGGGVVSPLPTRTQKLLVWSDWAEVTTYLCAGVVAFPVRPRPPLFR